MAPCGSSGTEPVILEVAQRTKMWFSTLVSNQLFITDSLMDFPLTLRFILIT